MFNKVGIIFIVFIAGRVAICPPSNLLSPCTCKDDVIECGGYKELDLSNIFDSLSESLNQKHFKAFHLNNTQINELKANTFGRITFDSIHIEDCINLTSIDRNTFSEANLVTDHLIIVNNTKLSNQGNSMFEILSKFKNASRIDFGHNTMRVIPSNAFTPINGYQDQLKTLYIYGSNFEEIGENAFYNLNSLTQLQIYDTNINIIPSNAFAFREKSDKVLDLYIYKNKFIQNYNISQNAFLSLKRPTNLWIDDNNDYDIQYLDEKLFLTFLLENELNQIITQQLLDCNDCRNVWLKNDLIIQKRIDALKCSNNKTINDQSNFKKCILK